MTDLYEKSLIHWEQKPKKNENKKQFHLPFIIFQQSSHSGFDFWESLIKQPIQEMNSEIQIEEVIQAIDLQFLLINNRTYLEKKLKLLKQILQLPENHLKTKNNKIKLYYIYKWICNIAEQEALEIQSVMMMNKLIFESGITIPIYYLLSFLTYPQTELTSNSKDKSMSSKTPRKIEKEQFSIHNNFKIIHKPALVSLKKSQTIGTGDHIMLENTQNNMFLEHNNFEEINSDDQRYHQQKSESKSQILNPKLWRQMESKSPSTFFVIWFDEPRVEEDKVIAKIVSKLEEMPLIKVIMLRAEEINSIYVKDISDRYLKFLSPYQVLIVISSSTALEFLTVIESDHLMRKLPILIYSSSPQFNINDTNLQIYEKFIQQNNFQNIWITNIPSVLFQFCNPLKKPLKSISYNSFFECLNRVIDKAVLFEEKFPQYSKFLFVEKLKALAKLNFNRIWLDSKKKPLKIINAEYQQIEDKKNLKKEKQKQKQKEKQKQKQKQKEKQKEKTEFLGVNFVFTELKDLLLNLEEETQNFIEGNSCLEIIHNILSKISLLCLNYSTKITFQNYCLLFSIYFTQTIVEKVIFWIDIQHEENRYLSNLASKRSGVKCIFPSQMKIKNDKGKWIPIPNIEESKSQILVYFEANKIKNLYLQEKDDLNKFDTFYSNIGNFAVSGFAVRVITNRHTAPNILAFLREEIHSNIPVLIYCKFSDSATQNLCNKYTNTWVTLTQPSAKRFLLF